MPAMIAVIDVSHVVGVIAQVGNVVVRVRRPATRCIGAGDIVNVGKGRVVPDVGVHEQGQLARVVVDDAFADADALRGGVVFLEVAVLTIHMKDGVVLCVVSDVEHVSTQGTEFHDERLLITI
jgi:hypothetical protein